MPLGGEPAEPGVGGGKGMPFGGGNGIPPGPGAKGNGGIPRPPAIQTSVKLTSSPALKETTHDQEGHLNRQETRQEEEMEACR